MSIIWILPGLAACFLALLMVRAMGFRPKEGPRPETAAVDVDENAAAIRLQAMIQKRTVSNIDPAKVDQQEFAGFRELLADLYPAVHEKCSRERIGANGLLYHWEGKNGNAPSVLMAHYDVVPAKEEWREPPFSGKIQDGELWGRGALDTKCTLHGIMEAAEALCREGFVPENDMYFAFGGDEEVMGQDAPAIAAELERRGVKPAFVLDEGGAMMEGVFPGVKRRAALVGIAEKGSVFLDIRARGRGGHASAPPAKQSLATLAKAIRRLEKKPMPFRLTKPVRELFDVVGRHSAFAYRLIFANLWCFWPLLNRICRMRGGELNALVRTTCAYTMASGADAYNVLPREVAVGVNLRLVGGETVEQVIRRMEKAIGDSNVRLCQVEGVKAEEASAVSKTDDAAWARLDTAIRQTYPDALVAPYLMVAATDSRHYCPVSEHVYRFSGIPLAKKQRKLIHNANERIPVALLKDSIGFFTRVIRMS